VTESVLQKPEWYSLPDSGTRFSNMPFELVSCWKDLAAAPADPGTFIRPGFLKRVERGDGSVIHVQAMCWRGEMAAIVVRVTVRHA